MKVDRLRREIELKVVYYGPGLAGKTTNMQYVFARTEPTRRDAKIGYVEPRIITFSFLAQSLAPINGLAVRLRLAAASSNLHRDEARSAVLENADGVVFVADSQRERTEANLECFEDLVERLERARLTTPMLPLVFQYNKQALPNALAVTKLERVLNPRALPAFAANARDGEGVFDTLKAIVRMIVERIPVDPPPSQGTPYR